MDRIRIAKTVYAAGLVAMPLTYGLRDLLGLSITWVDPTLILGFLVFVLLYFPISDRKAVWLVAYSLVAAGWGALLTVPAADRGKTALYIIFMEPARLALNVVWYLVSVRFLTKEREFVMRWLVISVAVQMTIASYLYLALYDLLPAPDIVSFFLVIYKLRQSIWIGDVSVYRMVGTFFESPPFSLFMFCCFVVFSLALLVPGNRRVRVWNWWGFGMSLLGAIMGLAGQVLLALPIFGFGLLPKLFARTRALHRALWVLLLGTILVGGLLFVGRKYAAARTGQDLYGSSFAERMFHSRYGISLFSEQPASVILGIGPGRYGDYAVRTGVFPSTVTFQVTPVEWLVEYGVLGCLLIASWILVIGKRSFAVYGGVGVAGLAGLVVANMFQANWKWEAWFFALAFLYASAEGSETEAGPAHS